MSKSKKYYITTPIYYANDEPHIGHSYTTILADVLTRYHKTAGEDTFFLTGLDEHGLKVQQAAESNGIDPQTHCDRMAPKWKILWEKLHIQYNDFIRTTEPRHEKVVQDVLIKVNEVGDIYIDEYGGHYCVGCERFYTEKELEGGKCPQHEKELEFITEKNYFFKMSKYQQQLIDYIHANPEFIQPEHRKNEILGFLRQPLEDLCISRPKSRLSWGVELPFDDDYVTYVWFDALLNYVTGPGYGSDTEAFEKWWPEAVHLIGKDILMTHAIYWPTMLMSAGIPLPKTIFAHGWWLMEESKMSKSLGNVVNPMELIDEYGVDPVRYYLMREMVLGQDSNFTMDSFIKRYNSDLANDFGNLLSRVSRLIEKNFDGILPEWDEPTSAEKTLQSDAEATAEKVNRMVRSMRINEAIEETMQFIRSVNRYMEQNAPWKLVKTDKDAAGRVLMNAAEGIRFSALLLEPVMPNRILTVLETLNSVGTDLNWGGLTSGNQLQTHPPLFPRIDVEAKAKQKPEPKPKEKALDNVITFDDFLNVKLKTAKVLEVEKVEGADRLLKLQIDVGNEQRQIVAGIAEFYQPEEVVGKMIVIVTNLAPAKIRGIESQGMLLAAKKGKKLTLVTVEDPSIGNGVSVS